MKLITSDSNPRYRQAKRLHESRGRRQQRRFLIFGASEISLAMESGFEIREFFCCPELFSQGAKHTVKKYQVHSRPESYQLPVGLFEKLCFGDRLDGLIAVAVRPDNSISRFTPTKDSLLLVLEAIEKPGNMGAVFRSADAAGVHAVLLADPISEPFHPNAIRSSLGTVFSTPSYIGTSSDILECLRGFGFSIFAARVEAKTSYLQADLTGNAAIVLGNEANGLSDFWQGPAVQQITVPMVGRIDSLNVAMTSTLLAFEALRQRQPHRV